MTAEKWVSKTLLTNAMVDACRIMNVTLELVNNIDQIKLKVEEEATIQAHITTTKIKEGMPITEDLVCEISIMRTGGTNLAGL